jgi:methyl-accepting chemotaxis protein
MKKFQELKIGVKLVLGFSIMIFFVGIIGISGLMSVRGVHKNLEEIYHDRLWSIDYLCEADRDLQQLLVAERSMIFADVRTEVYQGLLADYEENVQQSGERWGKYRALHHLPEEKAIIPLYEKARGEWMVLSQKIVEGRKQDTRSGRRLAIDLSLAEAKEKFEEMREYINRLEEINLEMAERAHDAAEANYRREIVTSVYLVIVGIIIGLFLMLTIRRSVTKPVEKVVDMIQDIAKGEGDLTKQIDVQAKDEIGELAQSFNTFVSTLHDIIAQVKLNTSEVASAVNRISSTSAQLAAGAEEQTSQAGEVASSVNEMMTAIIQNSQNASQTVKIAEQANAKAQEGTKAMLVTKQGMEEIVASATKNEGIIKSLSSRADQIGDIVRVIDDIASQTSLLALNAAIEAASAGEQGLGFGVVADEVRKLAERTTGATKQIAEGIEAIQSDAKEAAISMFEAIEVVKRGKEVTAKTERVLNEIVKSVTHVMDMIQQIATASQEQSSGANEISKNVSTISAVTKQSASSAEQMAATAEQLNRQTENLRKMVNQFKLKDDASFTETSLPSDPVKKSQTRSVRHIIETLRGYVVGKSIKLNMSEEERQ